MKKKCGKCHLFVSGNKCEHMWVKIGNDTVPKPKTVTLICITIDDELKHFFSLNLNTAH